MAMNPLDTLTLEAFHLALQTPNLELPPDLQQQIERELTQLANDSTEANGQNNGWLDGLRTLVKTHEPLHTAYQEARLQLQSQEGQRHKRLVSQTQALLTHVTPVAVHPPSVDLSSDDRPSETAPPSLPHSPTPPLPTTPRLQRFVLPANATQAQRQDFDRYITELKRLNPHWSVNPDLPAVNEADAYVMIYNDADYAPHYAAYLATRLLSNLFATV